MFRILNVAVYLAFTIFGLAFMGVILVGLTIEHPIPTLAGVGFSFALFWPLLWKLWPLVRLIMVVLRSPKRPLK